MELGYYKIILQKFAAMQTKIIISFKKNMQLHAEDVGALFK